MLMQSARHTEPYGLPLAGCDDRYADRAAAGRELAALLQPYRGGRAIVLALPPGGVAAGVELARALRLPLDVLIAREFVLRPYPAIVAGALSEGGGLCVNAALLRLPGAQLAGIWSEARRARRDIESLVVAYRNDCPLPPLGRRPVILVDDGLGNGLLQLAALAALRHYHPQRCIVATPYGTQSALGHIARMADELVTLTHITGERQDAIKRWQYALGDDDAAALLHRWQIAAAIPDSGNPFPVDQRVPKPHVKLRNPNTHDPARVLE
jgi:putative phosphoribosyl transferase